MLPAVRRLQDTYGDSVAFQIIDAESGTGAGWFEQLALPGHPSYVVFTADEREVFRTFGVVDAETLEAPIRRLLE